MRSADTVAPEDVVVTHGPFIMTKLGVVLERPDTFEEWQAAMQWVQQVEGAIQFWVGDLVEHGEHSYGEKYSQALEATEYAYQTLKNAAYVSRSVPPHVRRPADRVSWSHHAEVAPLPHDEQDHWLQKSEDEGLTREQLRSALYDHKATAKNAPVQLWLIVSCVSAEDQTALYNRMLAEGRNCKLSLKGVA